MLVAAMVRTWGTRPVGRGKVVWAEMARID